MSITDGPDGFIVGQPMTPPADAPLTLEARATDVYAALLRDLSERGLGDVWQSIDVDTRNVDIRPAWQALILAALRATEQETRQQEQLDAFVAGFLAAPRMLKDNETGKVIRAGWRFDVEGQPMGADLVEDAYDAWLRARATERGGSQ